MWLVLAFLGKVVAHTVSANDGVGYAVCCGIRVDVAVRLNKERAFIIHVGDEHGNVCERAVSAACEIFVVGQNH